MKLPVPCVTNKWSSELSRSSWRLGVLGLGLGMASYTWSMTSSYLRTSRPQGPGPGAQGVVHRPSPRNEHMGPRDWIGFAPTTVRVRRGVSSPARQTQRASSARRRGLRPCVPTTPNYRGNAGPRAPASTSRRIVPNNGSMPKTREQRPRRPELSPQPHLLWTIGTLQWQVPHRWKLSLWIHRVMPGRRPWLHWSEGRVVKGLGRLPLFSLRNLNSRTRHLQPASNPSRGPAPRPSPKRSRRVEKGPLARLPPLPGMQGPGGNKSWNPSDES